MRKLLRFAGKYTKFLIAAPLLIIGEVLMETIIPLLTAQLVNLLTAAEETSLDFRQLLGIGGIMLGMACVSLLFGAGSARCASVGAIGFAKNLRRGLFDKVQHFSFKNIDKFSTASLITRLTTDVNHVQQMLMMLVRMAVRSPIMFVMALIMAWRISPSLITVLLVAIPILVIGMVLMVKFAFPRFTIMMKKYDALNADVQENLTAIRVVKAFVREKFEKSKFADASNDVQNAERAAERVTLLGSPLMNILMNGCVVTVMWLAGHKIVGGTMAVGDMTAFITYITQILMSLMMLSMIFVNMILSKASINRINEVLEETPEIVSPENALTTVANGDIVFDHVSFSYVGDKEHEVLRDISLNLRSGQTVGILGGTGTGKTSLVSMIPRLYDASEGTVLVGGHNVREYDTTVLRDAVAMVLQKNVLFSGTIAENLRWGNQNATQDELTAACQIAQADEFVRSFPDGYETDLGQGGVNVSGGQKQRLCIARALLKKPKVMILDDATSAVDTATDAKIREGLKTQMPDTTKIIIAQRITSVMDADQIIVLDDGAVSDVGTHQELLARCTIYREVWESQQKGAEN